MSNLNAISIFGHELDWTVSTTVLILMLAEVVIAAVALIVFVLLMVRKHAASRKRQNILVTRAAVTEKERLLVGIHLDTVVVQREFKVGEPFNYEGLVVTAEYSSQPLSENITTGFTVEEPPMYEEGKPTVTVRYGKFSAFYTVSVVAAEEERIPIGISLDTSAVPHEFPVGGTFNAEGLIVNLSYNKEPYFEQTSDFVVEPPYLGEEGTVYVTVRSGELVTTYPVAVVAPPARNLIALELDLGVVKTDFVVGEAFDSTGLGVYARYDAEPEQEQVFDYEVEAPDLSHEGIANVTVHYRGFTQTYPVFVTEGRALVGISLDTSVVRREFTVGEEFNCMGLIVTADFDAAPFSEPVSDYEVETPDMTAEGTPEVIVRYLGKSASYTVSVVAAKEEPEEVPAEVPAEGGVLRYDKSFTARLIQSSDETKHWYTLLKNELLSYRKVKDRMSWKRETYRIGRETVAKFSFRGNTLCLFLPLDPAEYAESKYKVEDVSANKSAEDTPCMYRIKNDRRVKRACELIAVVMERFGAEKTERIAEDYYLPYEGNFELVVKGLAKRIIVSGEDFGGMGAAAPEEEVAVAAEEAPEAPASAPVIRKVEVPAPVFAGEESVEGGTLRYDRSFRAKLIQSDDETKRYYSVIKNELLAYAKVHDRLSWKRETYKAAGGCVAKISYRGSTLCLYLPLDVAEYEGTRYKVEDASANRSYSDTPCMFRIKNEKRLRLAADLIARVMEDRGLERRDRPEEDYAEPYQDIVQLIEMGLVRREIKSKEEEDSVFKKA